MDLIWVNSAVRSSIPSILIRSAVPTNLTGFSLHSDSWNRMVRWVVIIELTLKGHLLSHF